LTKNTERKKEEKNKGQWQGAINGTIKGNKSSMWMIIKKDFIHQKKIKDCKKNRLKTLRN
jgi:hypothetical protein